MGLTKFRSIREMPVQARNAYVASLVLFVIGIIATPIYFYLAVRAESWQVLAATGAGIVVTVGGYAGMRLSRRERVVASAQAWIGSIIVASIMIGTFIAGIGLVTGLLVVVLSLQISSQTMPPRTAFRALLAAIASAVFSGSMELLAPDFQFQEPLLRPLILIFAAFIFIPSTFILVRQFRSYPLQTKLAMSFLTVSFISVGIIVASDSISSQNAFTTQLQQSLLAAAEQTAVRIDDFIRSSLSALRADAQLPDWEPYLTEPQNERAGGEEEFEAIRSLQALALRDTDHILSYALFDGSGRKLLDSSTLSIDEDESARDYIQTPLQSRQSYISPVEFSSSTGAVFHLSSPILDASSQLIGVLRIRYDMAAIQTVLEDERDLVGAHSYPILLDENYIYLGHAADPSRQFKLAVSLDAGRIAELQAARRLPNEPDTQLIEPLLDLEQGLTAASTTPNFQITDNGQVHQAAAFGLDTRPWSVVFVQLQDAFLIPIEAQTRNSLLLAVFIAGVVAVMSSGVGRSFVAPLERLTAVAQHVARGDLNTEATIETADEIGELASTFNQMTAQLRGSLAELEQRVADRTHALETTTQVSRRLSTILDEHALAVEVVEQVREAFQYYYAQLYLIDAKGDMLRMVGGSGEIGQKLLEQGHMIPQGKGLIGRAAEENMVVLVPDVSQEPDWLANPMLPETCAEAVVPIAIGDTILGVLDVQHNVVNGLNEHDLELLKSIANQTAIALQNARSFERIQQQARRDALIGDISQRIQNTSTVQEALQVAVRELGHALGAKHSGVRLRLTEDESRDITKTPLQMPIEHNGH